VRPEALQHGTVAEQTPWLAFWQHLPPPFARLSQIWPVPVQPEQVLPTEPQFVFVVPLLHVPLAQQPSGQVTGPQTMASHRQVTVLKDDPEPHLLLTHALLHSSVSVGHTHCPPILICPAFSQPVPPGFQLSGLSGLVGSLVGLARTAAAGAATRAPPSREPTNTRRALPRETVPVPTPRARSSKP
jgi:hypothetical protein